jgi:hypothetical protein
MLLASTFVLGLVTVGEVLEGGMLVCFGVSWPVDIVRTIRTGRRPELITLLYVFNAAAIIVDIAVTLRLRRRAGVQPGR